MMDSELTMYMYVSDCDANQYTCPDGSCIPARAVCDGGCDCRPNCEDENGSGEYNCQCKLNLPTCEKSQFEVKSSRNVVKCVSSSLVDGKWTVYTWIFT